MSTNALRKDTRLEADFELLTRLNREYIQAVNDKDVGWFERHLSQDFLNTSPDGALLERGAFLAKIAQGVGVTDIEAHDVVVRVIEDLALVHARTTHRSTSGVGQGRYTDIWSRQDGDWLCVAAHVSRC